MRFRRGADKYASLGVSPDKGLNLDSVLGLHKPERVLPNKPGLTDPMDLLRYEARVTSVSIPVALGRLQHTHQWGLKQWRLAHHIIFNPVYDWAGKLRTVNIKKDDRLFVDKDKIEYSVHQTFRSLYARYAIKGDLATGLKQLPPDQFAMVFAKLYNDLNLAHPFREGNGRSLKTVLTAMARQAGYDFKWGKIAEKKWSFDEGCKEAARGDISRLAGLFGEVMEPFLPENNMSIRTAKRLLYSMFNELACPVGGLKRPTRSDHQNPPRSSAPA